MSEGFIGEIRMFGGNFAPVNWRFCDGSLMSISENDALFTILGTMYGGDGQTTFALPDLRGRVPAGRGTGVGTGHTAVVGEQAGVESVMLTAGQMPVHSHTPLASVAQATATDPTGATWAAVSTPAFTTGPADTSLAGTAIDGAGGGRPHENRVPSLGLSFIICTAGIFPPLN